MRLRTLQRSVSLLAFCAGVAAAVAIVAAGWMPASKQRLGLDLRLLAHRTGELAVAPTGPLLEARGMEPGTERSAARGRVRIINETAVPLAVRVRAHSALADTNRQLRIRIADGRDTVFAGTLGALQRWTARSVGLGVGRGRTLELRAWLEGQAGGSYRGRIQDVTLDFTSQRVARREQRGVQPS